MLRTSRTVSAAVWLLLGTLLVGTPLLTAGCAGPRESVDEAPEAPEELPAPAVDLARYEDFDPSAYPEEPPRPRTVDHEVPADLMDGRVTGATSATVQGFRVQLYSTVERDAAVRMEEDLKAWWRSEREMAPSGLFPEELPVFTRYLQPYYRVRVGNFASREAADRARAYLARHYPDAFVVPDTVTVRR